MLAGAGAGSAVQGVMKQFEALVGLLPGYDAGLGWILPDVYKRQGHKSACWLHNRSVKAQKGEVKLI